MCVWCSLHYDLSCKLSNIWPVSATYWYKTAFCCTSVTYLSLAYPCSLSPISRALTACVSTAARQSCPLAAPKFSPDIPRQSPLCSHSREPFLFALWQSPLAFCHSAFIQNVKEVGVARWSMYAQKDLRTELIPPTCCRVCWLAFGIFPWAAGSTLPLAFVQFILCPPCSSAYRSCCFGLGCFLVTRPELWKRTQLRRRLVQSLLSVSFTEALVPAYAHLPIIAGTRHLVVGEAWKKRHFSVCSFNC